MPQKIVAVVVGVVGLWLNTWHSASLPFNHFAVFGGGRDGFGAQHSLHSLIGLVLIVLAVWLWLRARKATAPAT
jgi:uncharacterized membrane protein